MKGKTLPPPEEGAQDITGLFKPREVIHPVRRGRRNDRALREQLIGFRHLGQRVFAQLLPAFGRNIAGRTGIHAQQRVLADEGTVVNIFQLTLHVQVHHLQGGGQHNVSVSLCAVVVLVGIAADEPDAVRFLDRGQGAVSGITDKMVAFERTQDGQGNYRCDPKLIDLSEAANTEKKVPLDWINEEGNGVNKNFVDYALPLIQGSRVFATENGLPRFAILKKSLANKTK